jgi:hypothetical protein
LPGVLTKASIAAANPNDKVLVVIGRIVWLFRTSAAVTSVLREFGSPVKKSGNLAEPLVCLCGCFRELRHRMMSRPALVAAPARRGVTQLEIDLLWPRKVRPIAVPSKAMQ